MASDTTTFSNLTELYAYAQSMCLLMVTKLETDICERFYKDSLHKKVIKTYIVYREKDSDFFFRFEAPLTLYLLCDPKTCQEIIFYIDFCTQRMSLQIFPDKAFDETSPESLHKDTINDLPMFIVSSMNPIELLDNNYLNDIINIQTWSSEQAKLDLEAKKDLITKTYDTLFYQKLENFLEVGANLFQTSTNKEVDPNYLALQNKPTGLELKIRKEREGLNHTNSTDSFDRQN